MHNVSLEKIINGYSFTNPNDSLSMANSCRLVIETDLTDFASDSMANLLITGVSNSSKNLQDLINSLNSQAAVNIVQESNDFINNNKDNINYSLVENFVNQEDSKVSSLLTGTDSQRVLVFLSLLKHSSYFWLPSNLGGSGIGYNFLKSASGANSNNQSMTPYAAGGVKELVAKAAVVGLADADAAAAAASEFEWTMWFGAQYYLMCIAVSAATASGVTAAEIISA